MERGRQNASNRNEKAAADETQQQTRDTAASGAEDATRVRRPRPTDRTLDAAPHNHLN